MKRSYIFLLCFLIGCSVIPTSTEKNPTLITGRIIFLGNDYVSDNGITFEGPILSDIEITLLNIATDEPLHFSSGKNGLFHANLEEGKYRIDRLYIKKTGYQNAWAYIYTNPVEKVFEIEKGKVNNVGTIHWTLKNKKHQVIQSNDSLTVKNQFAKQFSKSNWNQEEWKFASWDFEKKKEITYYVKSDNGKDSTRITIPEDMPLNVRKQIETKAKTRMNQIVIQEDTTYFIK